MRPRAGQHAIDGRRADLQDLGLDDRVQVEMAMPLHGIDQHRDQRPYRQCLGYRLVVHAVAQAYFGCWTELPARNAERMLAVVASQGHEFVEDLDPFAERRAAMARVGRL